MSLRELTAGQVIAERYRLLALRGSGGMGSVWRAVQLRDQRECALKIVHRSALERGERMHERFLREARAACAIDSPHAVRVFDYGVHDELPFLAMELLEGETLASCLQRQGRLPPLETGRILADVARGLERAHELSIVHRDLKPENVFLARTERGTVAKVLDFGIAKLHDDDALARDLTQTGALLGTPYYMSPEQIEGARYVDHRADLWSLGVIAFECITGERPFKGDGLRALFSAICMQAAPVPSKLCAVPSGFDAWFARACQKDPARRFRSAAELATTLQQICEHELALMPTQDESAPGDPPSARSEGARRDTPLAQPRSGRGAGAMRLVLASAVLATIAGWLALQLFTGASPAPASANAAASPRTTLAAAAPSTAVAATAAASSKLPAADGAASSAGSGPSSVAEVERTAAAPAERPERARPPRRARSRSAPEPESLERSLPQTREAPSQVAAPAQRGDQPADFDLELMLRDRK